MGRIVQLKMARPQPKQKLFLNDRHKYVGYGGARGGGKSWAIRTKAKLLALKYPGIHMLIVRRSYPELIRNHIRILRRECIEFAKYNDKDKALYFKNGSILEFMYCARDTDLDRVQGAEWDIIFLDEATQLSEYQIKSIIVCMRATNDFPKRCYFTMNPGGQGHGYIKRIFIERRFNENEDPDEYSFIQAKVADNLYLMQKQPDYVKQLQALPPKLREAWYEGSWDIYEGQFFEDFMNIPAHYRDRQFTHVIEPFEIPQNWKIYRSYDYGFNKPFSCGWWAVDHDGVIYRILEMYGCTKTPNEGMKWTPEKQFEAIARVEREHRWLKGKDIIGIADPSIFNQSTGPSIAETAMQQRVFFTPGDNTRIAGWMQCHYRLAFDENGYPMMYVFNTCEAFIRTIPLLLYDEHVPEDIDTEMEDHVADEWRYFCMSRPLKPQETQIDQIPLIDPLNQFKGKKRYRHFNTI